MVEIRPEHGRLVRSRALLRSKHLASRNMQLDTNMKLDFYCRFVMSLSLVVQKAWLSFAAYLNPNRLGDLNGEYWPRYRIGRSIVLSVCLSSPYTDMNFEK